MCEHLDSNNERDCENDGVNMCMCCSAVVCEEHTTKTCPYGGMGYIELI